MNTTADPNSSGSASLPTTLTGELQRLRHVPDHLFSWTQWWTHYENLNLGNRAILLHRTAQTTLEPFLMGRTTLASSSSRFHLLSFEVGSYNAGEAHPESAFLLLHVGTTVRFMVGIGGDVHVGSTLGLHAQGVAGFPAFYRTGDTNTGLFWPVTDALAVTTGGSERARFDAAGRLGIGTTNPTDALHVVGSIQVRDTVHAATLSVVGFTATTLQGTTLHATGALNVRGTAALTLVGVNQDSPTATLHVNGTTAVRDLLTAGGAQIGGTARASILHAQTTLAVNERATVGALTVGGLGLTMSVPAGTPFFNLTSTGNREWRQTAVTGTADGQIYTLRDETAAINRMQVAAFASGGTEAQFILRGAAYSPGDLLQVISAATNHLTVLSGGNVLVNTRLGVVNTDPAHALHVTGSVAVRDTLHVGSSLGVGVAPTSTLHVAGTMTVMNAVTLGALRVVGGWGGATVRLVCVDIGTGQLYASNLTTACSLP